MVVGRRLLFLVALIRLTFALRLGDEGSENLPSDEVDDANTVSLIQGQSGKGSSGKSKHKKKWGVSLPSGLKKRASHEAQRLLGRLGSPPGDGDLNTPAGKAALNAAHGASKLASKLRKKPDDDDEDEDEDDGDDEDEEPEGDDDEPEDDDEDDEEDSKEEEGRPDEPKVKSPVKKSPSPVTSANAPKEDEDDNLPGPVLHGVHHCDKCKFDSSHPDESVHAGCRYPSDVEFSMSWKPSKTVAFNVTSKMGCRAQMHAAKRFDNGEYDLSTDWKECAKAALAPASNRAFEAGSAGDGHRVQFAGKNELMRIVDKCGDLAKKLSKGYANLLYIAFPEWRQAQLIDPLKNPVIKNKLMNGNFQLVGPKSQMKALGESIPELKNKIAILDFAPSGALGADIQIIALLATGRIRALWMAENWKLDCHRCDISSVIQVCKGRQKYAGANANLQCLFGVQSIVRKWDPEGAR
eukprot:TRINITY_DN9992_c0_g1_i1.p1 TRINITY_DN9992_c0_g1~~TRINITY_DN9992_c0_g1_i1.p1  ORF type:complete len:466 (+),score=125.06 TRINITY_DN9992_c0_g1_i1:72-1469(+)